VTQKSGRLSVKQVAEVVGVSPRTVRHYHSIGVLSEPPRDASGYRRYGGKEVVELVRIVRLRALGMPLPQIAERVGGTEADDELSLRDALDGLADELDAEIARLVAGRDRLRELAKSETFDQPDKALTQALQDHGVLGPADHLGPGERWAAAVVDALHPEGMPGVLALASRLFDDATVSAALGPLRRRLGRLNARSSDAEIAALAADVAAMLPSASADLHLDLGLVEVLLIDRLNPARQRFMHQLRAHLQDKA
jgi:DNA-binding transcriptional MerR regulator